jgi:hypothetical protein
VPCANIYEWVEKVLLGVGKPKDIFEGRHNDLREIGRLAAFVPIVGIY